MLIQQSNALLQNARFISNEKSDLEAGLDKKFLSATNSHIVKQEEWLNKLKSHRGTNE